MPGEIGTIGHSNREPGEFPGLLAAPGRVGSGSRHFGDLGGRRDARAPRSPNTAWRVEAFHACADSRATPPFAAALDELIANAERARTVILCSEAVPWRCHRRLIADALIVRAGPSATSSGRARSSRTP
jgi:hypothetical protein